MFFTNYSAQTLFDSLFLFLFNTLYSAVPILVYGMLEQNRPARALLNTPRLYAQNARNCRMSRRAVSLWLAEGVWHAFVSFFMWYLLWQRVTTTDRDIYVFQTAVSQTCVIIVNLKVLTDKNKIKLYSYNEISMNQLQSHYTVHIYMSMGFLMRKCANI
jgi:magnesium-transporting ATPase (P-type)